MADIEVDVPGEGTVSFTVGGYGRGSGSGGGGTGDVLWGPDFGAPMARLGVNLDAVDVGIGAEKNVGAALRFDALIGAAAQSVGARLDASMQPGYGAGVGVGILPSAVALGGGKGIGVDPDADAILSYANPNVGQHLSGVISGGPPFWMSSSSLGATGSGSASLAIPKPAGLAVGDLMVACVSFTTGGGGTVTEPSGWTTFQNPAAAIRGQWKIATAADVAASTFTWSISGASGTVNMSGGIHRIVGFNAANPINISAAATASAANPVAPSVTTTVTNCLLLPMGFQAPLTAVTYTPQSGWVETWDVAGGSVSPVCSFGAYRVVAAAGATGSVTFTSTSGLASTYRTITAAIAPGTLTLAA